MKTLIVLLALAAAPIKAQVVSPCFEGSNMPYQASAAAIAEPWEDNTRVFSEGRVRVSVMDTWEPALGAFYLMVLVWPEATGEPDIRDCSLISRGALGFVSMTLDGLVENANTTGQLALLVPVVSYDPTLDALKDAVLEVTVEPQTGEVAARLR